MHNIFSILSKYQGRIDYLDLELITSRVIKKPREFVLAHSEKLLTKNQALKIKKFIKRRKKHEPLAYILENKEFYGLNFKVNKNTLIPRPETEPMVDIVIKNILKTKNHKLNTIIDVGTGSGNIIISLVKNILSCHPELVSGSKRCRNKFDMTKLNFIATDISNDALKIAKHNAKRYKLDKKIKFLQGNLIDPIIKNIKCSMFYAPCSMIILANLPYLSKNIYSKASPDIKKFEPKSALLSGNDGLAHCEKLLKQIKKYVTCYVLRVTCFIESSPEQKKSMEKMIKFYFPSAKINFQKDLAKKWRIAQFEA